MSVSSFVESVEFIEIALAWDATSSGVLLSKGQNYQNCIPFFTQKGASNTNATEHLVDFYFSGTTESGIINFSRTAAGPDSYDFIDIACYIVEFNPSQVRVQQGAFTIPAESISKSSGWRP